MHPHVAILGGWFIHLIPGNGWILSKYFLLFYFYKRVRRETQVLYCHHLNPIFLVILSNISTSESDIATLLLLRTILVFPQHTIAYCLAYTCLFVHRRRRPFVNHFKLRRDMMMQFLQKEFCQRPQRQKRRLLCLLHAGGHWTIRMKIFKGLNTYGIRYTLRSAQSLFLNSAYALHIHIYKFGQTFNLFLAYF